MHGSHVSFMANNPRPTPRYAGHYYYTNGVETRWHPNGQKQSEATWQGGKTIAKEEWNEQGVPKQ